VELDANHSPPSSCKIKNNCRPVSFPPRAFVERRLTKPRDNLNLGG